MKTEFPLIGIFGGTFDPIHYGHLRIAEEIAEMTTLEKCILFPLDVLAFTPLSRAHR